MARQLLHSFQQVGTLPILLPLRRPLQLVCTSTSAWSSAYKCEALTCHAKLCSKPALEAVILQGCKNRERR